MNDGDKKLTVCYRDTDGDQIILKFNTEKKLWKFFINGILKQDNCSLSMELKSGKITVQGTDGFSFLGRSTVPSGTRSIIYKDLEAIFRSKVRIYMTFIYKFISFQDHMVQCFPIAVPWGMMVNCILA